ncbi:MAG: STAS domain-containing protein [bacterium]|nr:STAS domain-containing protein [bacterium]
MVEFIDTNDERTFFIKEDIVASKSVHIENLLNDFIRDDTRDIVIDLIGVTKIDSMSLASLIRVKNKLANEGRNLSIIHPNEGVMRVLELAGLDSFLLD